jgi:hypothetical protein
LLIAIFWEETRFENIVQIGGGPGVGFGQVEPLGVRLGCAFCGIIPAWNPADISPHKDDQKAVQITALWLHRLFCSSKAANVEQKKEFALKAYTGWFEKPSHFKGTLEEWRRKRQAIIDGWTECERHLQSRGKKDVDINKKFFVEALNKAVKGKPDQRYDSAHDDSHVFPNGSLPELSLK